MPIQESRDIGRTGHTSLANPTLTRRRFLGTLVAGLAAAACSTQDSRPAGPTPVRPDGPIRPAGSTVNPPTQPAEAPMTSETDEQLLDRAARALGSNPNQQELVRWQGMAGEKDPAKRLALLMGRFQATENLPLLASHERIERLQKASILRMQYMPNLKNPFGKAVPMFAQPEEQNPRFIPFRLSIDRDSLVNLPPLEIACLFTFHVFYIDKVNQEYARFGTGIHDPVRLRTILAQSVAEQTKAFIYALGQGYIPNKQSQLYKDALRFAQLGLNTDSPDWLAYMQERAEKSEMQHETQPI